MGEALTFRSVTKTYSRSHLGRTTLTRGIKDFSLQVRKGEAFGLLGLNGSGKTTTFKLALGLLRPSAGEISVLGHEPASSAARAQIGFLPELPYFYPFLTPREALRFYGRLSGLPEAELPKTAARALELVGLASAADRKMGEFSKGMIQRVGLAQAVLHDPELLILDEPASGLDPLAIKEFRDLLSGLNGRGKTLIISSHSISEVEKLCHRVGILKDGLLVRVLERKDWEAGLESVFIETVKS